MKTTTTLLFALLMLCVACEPKVKGDMKKKYLEWKTDQIVTGEYCAEKDCDPATVREKAQRGEDFCMMALPDTISIGLGDINGDGIKDGYSNVRLLQCDGGNALMFANKLLFFISNKRDGYSLLEEPDNLRSGIGAVTGIEDGLIVLTSQSYAEEDPRCCPSIERKTYFKYLEGDFIQQKKK